MGTSSMSVLFDVLITAFGGYILFAGFQMKMTHKIKGGMFLPQGIDPEKCLDRDGYIEYITPRFLLLGIICLLSGLLGLAADCLGILPQNTYFVITLLFLIFLVWYAVTIKKAVEKYWGPKKK